MVQLSSPAGPPAYERVCTTDDCINLDLDVKLAGDFACQATLQSVFLPPGWRNLGFKVRHVSAIAEMRVCLQPLFPGLPFFGGVSVRAGASLILA